MNIWGVSTFFAIVDNATVNLDVQISVGVPAFNSFGHIPGNRVASYMVVLHLTFKKPWSGLL